MKSIKNTIIFGLLLSASFALQAQTIAEGQLRTRNEQFDDAATIFQSILAKKPTNGEAYYYAGINALEMGDTTAAIEFFENGLTKAPKFPLSHVGKGFILMRQNKLTEAEAAFALAEKTKKKYLTTVYREIAKAYLVVSPKLSMADKKARAQKSLNYAEKALAIKEDYQATMTKGDALLILQPDKANLALEQYKLAQEMVGQPIEAFMREGKTFYNIDQYSTTIDRTQLVIGIDPNFAPAYRLRADAFAKMGINANGAKRAANFDSAVFYYKKYLSLNNNPSARLKYIQALLISENYQKCIDEGNNYLKTIKEVPIIYGWIAYSYAGMTDEACDSVAAEEGLSNFDKYLEKYLKPKNQNLNSQDKSVQAILLSRSNKLDVAYPLWEELLKDTAGTPKKYYRIAHTYYYDNWRKDMKNLSNTEMMGNMIGLRTAKKGNDTLIKDYYFLAMTNKNAAQYRASNKYYKKLILLDTAGRMGYMFDMARNNIKADLTDTLYGETYNSINDYLAAVKASPNAANYTKLYISMLNQKAAVISVMPRENLYKIGITETEKGKLDAARYQRMKDCYTEAISLETGAAEKAKIEERINNCDANIRYHLKIKKPATPRNAVKPEAIVAPK